MGAVINQDQHYTHNQDDKEVFTLTIFRENDNMSFSRSYTIPELQDIADAIIKFLEKRNSE